MLKRFLNTDHGPVYGALLRLGTVSLNLFGSLIGVGLAYDFGWGGIIFGCVLAGTVATYWIGPKFDTQLRNTGRGMLTFLGWIYCLPIMVLRRCWPKQQLLKLAYWTGGAAFFVSSFGFFELCRAAYGTPNFGLAVATYALCGYTLFFAVKRYQWRGGQTMPPAVALFALTWYLAFWPFVFGERTEGKLKQWQQSLQA